MIKLSELKTGDIVNVQFEEVINTGEVLQVDQAEKKVLVAHGDQEFWYDIEDITPVPLNVLTLQRLGFEKSDDPVLSNGAAAYVRGPFVVRFPDPSNIDHLILTYRDEHRDIHGPLQVHQFQNHYFAMTNMHLDLVD